VAGEDTGVLIDQDRIGPPELDHRGRDLIDLRVRVRARVALVRAHPFDRPQLDPLGERVPRALRRQRWSYRTWLRKTAEYTMNPLEAAVGRARRELGSACAFVWWAQTGGSIGHNHAL
jgi:hypothetical protein